MAPNTEVVAINPNEYNLLWSGEIKEKNKLSHARMREVSAHHHAEVKCIESIFEGHIAMSTNYPISNEESNAENMIKCEGIIREVSAENCSGMDLNKCSLRYSSTFYFYVKCKEYG